VQIIDRIGPTYRATIEVKKETVRYSLYRAHWRRVISVTWVGVRLLGE
jgi:hypothetical protein